MKDARRLFSTSYEENYQSFSTVVNIIDDDEVEDFVDESDIIDEIILDDEDLPDVDDEDDEVASSVNSYPQRAPSYTFTGHSGPMYAVACSPTDATIVASGSQDEKGFLWRIGSGDCLNELDGHKDSVCCLSFSTDGKLLASGGVDACVKIWDMSGNLKCSFEGPTDDFEIEWVRWHPSGHLVLAGCTDATVRLWNADKGTCLRVFYGHGESVTCGDFTPDGKTICTGSEDGTLRIWNPISGDSTLVRGYSYNSSALNCLSLTLDSTLALTGGDDGILRVANITTGKVVCSLSYHSGPIQCIGISSSGRWVATGGADQNLVICDLDHSDCCSICEHEADVTCLKWLGESKYVASGCENGQIIIWDARLGECIMTFAGHSEKIQDLTVSVDKNFLVSASEDGSVCVFDISSFK